MTQRHAGTVIREAVKPRHRCAAWWNCPGDAYPTGMIWRCECGKAWKCWHALGLDGWRRYRREDKP